MTHVQQIGQYFSLTAPTSVPAEWESWLVARTVLIAGQQIGPDRLPVYEEANDRAEMAALDAFARNLITYDPGATPEATVLSVQNIRYYVIAYCARRERWETVEGTKRRRPRLWVPAEVVDAMIERVLRNLWNRADWPFKRRMLTMTLTSGSVVTFNFAGSETFHSIASRRWFYDDATSLGNRYMMWSRDGTEFAQLRAYDTNSGQTGRPQYFRFEDNSGTFTWVFHPVPDATYTAKGEVYVQGPTLATTAAGTAGGGRFPTTFNHVIRDAVLAETLRHYGDPNGKQFWDDVENEISRLLPIYCDVGRQDDEQEVRDVYRDHREYSGPSSIVGGFM